MLGLLTGTQQTGKTRWLERLVTLADGQGIACKGVVSPGRWRREADGSLVKTGIDSLLLPTRELVPFAVDASKGAPLPEHPSTQSDSAGLGWRISDEAIGRINRHFDELAAEGLSPGDLLLVDELGMLEFAHGKGFTSAMRLLENLGFQPSGDAAEAGDRPTQNTVLAPAPASTAPAPGPHAIVIVRPSLVEAAKKRFAPAWGEPLVFDVSGADAFLESTLGLRP